MLCLVYEVLSYYILCHQQGSLNCLKSQEDDVFNGLFLLLCQLVTSHGLEADRHLLRCLFSHIDFSAEGSKTSSSKDFHQIQLLVQECVALLTKPALISNLCYALDNPLHHQKV